jgi:hypothetical protein
MDRLKGELVIDRDRGVIYFNPSEGPMRGVTKLRVSGAVILGNDTLIDVTSADHPALQSRFDLAKFSRVNRHRATSPDGFNHTLDSWSEAEWTNAMGGEAGEAQEIMSLLTAAVGRASNLAKKLLRHRDNVSGNNKEEDKSVDSLRLRAARETADVMIYGDLAIQRLGFETHEIMRSKFNDKSDELECAIRFDE